MKYDDVHVHRLKTLGYTMQDECIARAVAYMDAVLRGEQAFPDPWKKTHDWAAFIEMVMATWIRRFTLENEWANAVGEK